MPFVDNPLAVLTQCTNPIVGDNQPAVFVRVAMLDPTEFSADSKLTIDRPRSRPASRRFKRYLLAICIGVAGTLAWQSYGEATKQIIATRAPELGWSPETKQMIASWIERVGWTRPPVGPENTTAETVASTSKEPATPSLQQIQELRADIAGMRQTLETELAHMREAVVHLTASQELIVREIEELQATIPPQPSAAPEHKAMPVPPSSRAPTAPTLRH
jgi:hypothetical protein